MDLDDVIAAIATPHGEGAIGIVRVAGFGVFDVAARLIPGQGSKPDAWPSHRARHRVLHDPRTGERLDDALVLAFDREHSPAGMEMVEFHCHGGPLILSHVLDALLSAGARPANPGEFTMRAFMMGRMDLAQAEAVCDLIRAKTDAAHRVAMRQQSGALSHELKAIRDGVEGLLAHVEATIDFSEEIGDLAPSVLHKRVREARDRVDALIATGRAGRSIREGVRLAIVGRPNVGKSSLLNALLRQERAIVTDVPGTTRDTIEEAANILGIPVVAIDTAGLRHTRDTVELLGIRRTEEALAAADVVLLVADASEGWTSDDEDVAARLDGRSHLCLMNKIDLVAPADRVDVSMQAPMMSGMSGRRICVSAVTREGMDALERAIARMVTGAEAVDPESATVSSARHIDALITASAALARAEEAASAALTPDLLAVDLRAAIEALGRITGDSLTDGLIERVFQDFCVGK